MMRLLAWIFLLAASASWAGDIPDPSEEAPKTDTRMIRELQARAWGKPSLPTSSGRGEVALALAELNLAASVQGGSAAEGLGSQDYDALFSLLQRYRDDLLRLGMENSDMDAQLKILRLRSDEMKERLDNLKPKDGLKFHGRISASFDDMHLSGDLAVTGPGGNTANKGAFQSIRYLVGGVHSELKLSAQRGLLSGFVQYDLSSAWGTRSGDSGVRRIYVEMRLPVTIQFGDIDTKLSPLTLWRSEDYQPFEPQPFADRRQRLREDLLLVQDKWNVQGGRLSTDMRLFNAVDLEMESITFIAGYAAGASPPVSTEIYRYSSRHSPANLAIYERFSTFGEGWRVAVPVGPLKLSNYGLLFWDVTDTRGGSSPMRSQNALVYSGALDFHQGLFVAGAEYALSGYVPSTIYKLPGGEVAPLPAAMTGTALTYYAGVEHKDGKVRLFGRAVSDTFYSPGAQGRTVDYEYSFLGPFAMENTQVNVRGDMGLDPRIPTGYATRLNDHLLPPGGMPHGSVTANVAAATWQHLLAYSPSELIDPYGPATPNRAGFGGEATWKFFKGAVRPLVSYESFANTTKVATLDPFSMAQIRAGAFFDLKPVFNWPVRFQGGMTSLSSSNGMTDPFGAPYAINMAQTEAGAEWDFVESMTLSVGYRHLELSGRNETFDLSAQANAISGEPAGTVNGWGYDMIGYGLKWSPIKDVRFDAVYSDYTTAPLKFATTKAHTLVVGQGVLRMNVYF